MSLIALKTSALHLSDQGPGFLHAGSLPWLTETLTPIWTRTLYFAKWDGNYKESV